MLHFSCLQNLGDETFLSYIECYIGNWLNFNSYIVVLVIFNFQIKTQVIQFAHNFKVLQEILLDQACVNPVQRHYHILTSSILSMLTILAAKAPRYAYKPDYQEVYE